MERERNGKKREEKKVSLQNCKKNCDFVVICRKKPCTFGRKYVIIKIP